MGWREIIGIFFVMLILVACHGSIQDKTETPAATRDKLQSYAPGLGEFMLGFQVHHAKLWFAGNNKNWPLANFEVKEIDELADDIDKFCTDRPETRFLPMIDPAVDSLKVAILEHDLKKFRGAFNSLTKSCNDCHQVTKHSFNVICTPQTPPFTNQRYGNSE